MLELLPGPSSQPARRRGASALPGLRLIGGRRDRRWWQRSGASLASGLLLAAAFPPVDLGPLALVALVPLLWAWRCAGPGLGAWFGFVFGVGFFAGLLHWTWYFGTVAIVPLVIACALYPALTGVVVGALGRLGIRSPWLTAAAWVVFEALRGRWPLGGFPWGEVGVALHDLPPARALASFGGVLGVSYLVVVVNGLLLDAAIAARARAVPRLARAGAGLALVLVVVLTASLTRLDPTATGRLRFALLQGNDVNRALTADELDDRLLTRSHLALAEELEGLYDLIVFPESSLDADPESDPALRSALAAVAEEHDAWVLVNANTEDGEDLYNTNLMYDPDGALQGTYSKQHLVPFGEYVPFREWLGFIDETEQVERDYTTGQDQALFDVDGRPVASLICFEIAFARQVREVVRDGAELIVVSTNNRSYRRSGNAAQHLAISEMRAAETARPVLHASISGITGVIDASGRLRDRSELFVNEALTGEVATTTGTTPYVRFGEWVLWGSAAAVAISAVVGLARRRRRLRL